MSSTTQDIPILTITQLTNAIKLCLEATFPALCLQGEISNCKLQTSGHLYFSLKDSNAQISAIMFRADASQLKLIPKDGAQVIVKGEINVFPPSGKYQLIVREMRLMGLGELLLKLEELKIKLHKKGWFKSEHKKPLPKFPRKIGVVTSPTGAAIQDILNILTRRFSGFQLILNPVRVQGEGAAQEIAQAIHFFNKFDLVDVMIVGRGGGSIEDLWAFNEEIVAEAIFHSKIPIISAVGHETDHCIADYVADVRAPTPSAAAEIVIAEKAHQLHHLNQFQQRIKQSISHHIKQDRHRLKSICRQSIIANPYALLGSWMQKLDGLRIDIDHQLHQQLRQKRVLLDSRQKQANSLKPMNQIAHFKQKLGYWDKALQQTMSARLQNIKKIIIQKEATLNHFWKVKQENRRRFFSESQKRRQVDQAWHRTNTLRKERFEKLQKALLSINPKNLLTKGYCILFSEKDHSVITSIYAVEKQQDVRLFVSDGELLSTIKDIIPK